MGKNYNPKKNYKKYNNKKSNNQDYKYKTIYTKKDYEKDAYDFDKSLRENRVNTKAFQRLVNSDLIHKARIIETGKIGDYTLEEIGIAMQNKHNGWKILLAVSESLMRISPHYYRLNTFYSNMATFCWGLDLYDVKPTAKVENINKAFDSLSSRLERMNIKHEFGKIMKSLPYKDIFCGLVVEDTVNFYIQELDFRMCTLYEIQDGLFNFAINLSSINPIQLDAYPEYVRKAYIEYTEGLIGCHYVPPADKQICIKLNSQWLYPYPLLINLVDDILNLDTYKKLKLQSARTDNYKAIMIKVPIDEDTIDKPLLTPKTLATFAELNRESMTDDIGILHTLGSDGTVVSFKDSNNITNYVENALDDVYNASGISKELFNGSASGTAVTFSIENDSAFIYGVYRQFERWVNRYIKIHKFNKTNFKFSFYLLDVTIFNRKNVTDMYKDACTQGVTVLDKWYASLGITPSKIKGSYALHKNIYNFEENLIMLSSSYNSTGEANSSGRPTNESKGETLDESGQQTEDNDSNSKR